VRSADPSLAQLVERSLGSEGDERMCCVAATLRDLATAVRNCGFEKDFVNDSSVLPGDNHSLLHVGLAVAG
jgi:hypothetical protein